MTCARLPLGGIAAILVLTDRWHLAASAVALFVVLDVLDGRFARAGGLDDTAWRRMADAVIDKFSVHACMAGIAVTLPSTVPVWLAILFRDIWQSSVAATVLAQRRVVVAGAWWHRLFSLSMAVWAITIMLSRRPSLGLAALALAIGVATLADYSVQCTALIRRSASQAATTQGA
jgi:phosphatidylglycerophosphate synthase